MKRKKLSVEQEKYKVTMSVYYDLYTSGNPQKKEEQQALYAVLFRQAPLMPISSLN